MASVLIFQAISTTRRGLRDGFSFTMEGMTDREKLLLWQQWIILSYKHTRAKSPVFLQQREHWLVCVFEIWLTANTHCLMRLKGGWSACGSHRLMRPLFLRDLHCVHSAASTGRSRTSGGRQRSGLHCSSVCLRSAE